MSATQKDRLMLVIERMKSMASRDEYYVELFSEGLDYVFDEMVGNDCFGTEGEDDPRGDGRDGTWKMDHVQGID